MEEAVRLDVELVRRGLARSRSHAREVVDAGLVRADGRPAHRASTRVAPGVPLEVAVAPERAYVGRGARKLAGVLEALGDAAPRIAGRRCLDAGASTGGFTQVLLAAGAAQVVAVDVGHDQLAAPLRRDPRVVDLEATNVRALTADAVGGPVDLVVADLSFISLLLVLAALTAVTRPGADLLLLVKPQFEVGRERLGAHGVVRDPGQRAGAVLAVAEAAVGRGLVVSAVRASPLPGPSGNVEYFLLLQVPRPATAGGGATPAGSTGTEPTGGALTGAGLTGAGLVEAVRRAVADGPS